MRSVIIPIVIAALNFPCFADSGSKSFELNTPLPSSTPGTVITSMPVGQGATASDATLLVSRAVPEQQSAAMGLPMVPGSLPGPSSQVNASSVPSSGASGHDTPVLPVKAYGTLAQAAADGVNPLAVPAPKPTPSPVVVLPPSLKDKAIKYIRENQKVLELGVLLLVLIGFGAVKYSRRKRG